MKVEKWKRLESICLIASEVISHTGVHFSTHPDEVPQKQGDGAVESKSTVHQSGKRFNQLLSVPKERTFKI